MKRRYLLVDPQRMPCVWIIVEGQIDHVPNCKQPVLRGRCVQRGPDPNNPREVGTQGCGPDDTGSWMLNWSGTSWTEVGVPR